MKCKNKFVIKTYNDFKSRSWIRGIGSPIKRSGFEKTIIYSIRVTGNFPPITRSWATFHRWPMCWNNNEH